MPMLFFDLKTSSESADFKVLKEVCKLLCTTYWTETVHLCLVSCISIFSKFGCCLPDYGDVENNSVEWYCVTTCCWKNSRVSISLLNVHYDCYGFEIYNSIQFVILSLQYIQLGYHEDPEKYSLEIHNLESLRAMAVHPQHNVDGVSILKKYFCQLTFLRSRFPLTRDGGPIRINFSWWVQFCSFMVCIKLFWYLHIYFGLTKISYNQTCEPWSFNFRKWDGKNNK